MKPTADAIVAAAVDAAIAELKKHDLPADPQKLMRAFDHALREKSQVVSAVLVTPSGDAGPLGTAVTKMLETAFKRPVELTERADRTMIGGAVLLIGDERIDVSVRGALERAHLLLKQDEPSGRLA